MKEESDAFENKILYYEKDFFSAKFCSNINNLEERIHLNFTEYGKSGEIYKRKDVIDFLSGLSADRDILIQNFSVNMLSENAVIANYLSKDAVTGQTALRASVWLHEDNLWKIFFHQGTPCEQYGFTESEDKK